MFEKLQRSEIVLVAVLSFFAFTGVIGVALVESGAPIVVADPVVVSPGQPGLGPGEALDAQTWFRTVRQRCNPVEVETYMQWQPAPPGPDGQMYAAACYALAGRIQQAREVIESLPPGLRYEGAGVVFDAGHPAADAGDDVAAGPLMELVVEYWPNHYMALYHAGTARFELGDHSVARGYLERFLQEYQADDGWMRNARSMLESMERP